MPSPRRILVVERRPYVSDLLRTLLRLAGVVVDTAAGRVQAETALAGTAYAAVLVELDVTGALALCASLRARPDTARTLIFALERAPAPVAQADALAAGCDIVVSAPFDPFALAALLEQVLPHLRGSTASHR